MREAVDKLIEAVSKNVASDILLNKEFGTILTTYNKWVEGSEEGGSQVYDINNREHLKELVNADVLTAQDIHDLVEAGSPYFTAVNGETIKRCDTSSLQQLLTNNMMQYVRFALYNVDSSMDFYDRYVKPYVYRQSIEYKKDS